MIRKPEDFKNTSDFEELNDDEMTKSVEADFKAMMEDAIADARKALSNNPDELAQVEANFEQLLKGQALQAASQKAFKDGDIETAIDLDRQKMTELAEIVSRAGKRGGLKARFSSWVIRKLLKAER